MEVPILDLKKQHASLDGGLHAAIERVLDSGIFCLGPEVEAFEAAVGEWTAPAAALGVSSGTDALLVALLAIGLEPGDEVILPPFTFFATASAVVRAGGRPVFVDIEERTFNIDPRGIEAAVSPRTRAIIPVHLYGQCADMERITALAHTHGLAVIEDAAQALGARRGGQPAGSLGDLACFSFYPTKNLGAAGEAGLICARDPELLQRCRILRNQGMEPRYQHHVVGGNYRMDAMQAAVLTVKLAHLADWNERRRRIAGRYQDALAGTSIRCPEVDPGNTHIYHQFTIRSEHRDELARFLRDRGIGSGIYYPIPLHRQPCFLYLNYDEGTFPISERAAREVLSLPVYPEMSDGQIRHVADALHAFVSG